MAVDQQDAPLRTFDPRWPDRATIDPERVTFSYWRDIDTLDLATFHGSTPAEIAQRRRDFASGRRKHAAVATLFDDFGPLTAEITTDTR